MHFPHRWEVASGQEWSLFFFLFLSFFFSFIFSLSIFFFFTSAFYLSFRLTKYLADSQSSLEIDYWLLKIEKSDTSWRPPSITGSEKQSLPPQVGNLLNENGNQVWHICPLLLLLLQASISETGSIRSQNSHVPSCFSFLPNYVQLLLD